MSATVAPGERVRFLTLGFDTLSIEGVIAWLRARPADSAFAYVVTPNVDHMVRLEKERDTAVLAAFERADLIVCDSRILVRLAQGCGIDLTLVPGSDLTPRALAEAFAPGDRIALIGGAEGAAVALAARYPGLDVVQHIPPMGLRRDAVARAAAVDWAAAAGARAILLAVGSPQQELLAHEMRASGRVGGTALCIGASVDFLVGKQTRAPRLIQRAHLEWAWRLAGDPRRLWRRYLVEGPAIFGIVQRWRRTQRRNR